MFVQVKVNGVVGELPPVTIVAVALVPTLIGNAPNAGMAELLVA